MGVRLPKLFRVYDSEDYLETAIQASNWISQYEIKEKDGKHWNESPIENGSASIEGLSLNTSFYTGAAGVGFFYLRLYQITKEERFLLNAKEAAAFIISQTKGIDFYEDIREQIKNDKSSLAGMFLGYKTGPVGDALYLNSVYEVTGDKSYFDQAIKNIDILVYAAVKDEKGIYWSDVRDICADAGAIIALIIFYKKTGNKRYLEAAIEAGRFIEQYGHEAVTGGTYYDLFNLADKGWSDNPQVIHVNFVHGTNGIAYVWAALYDVTGDEKYHKLADDVIEYLDGVSYGDEEAVLFPYEDNPVTGEREEHFYLGACAGPTGSTAPFRLLYKTTKDEKYLTWVKRLANGLIRAKAPTNRSWGYWGSKGVCCGEAGVLEYFCQIYKLTGDERYLNAAHTTASTLLSEAITNANKTKWVGAWERVSPAKQGNYTGFYVGVSGVASALLQTYATDKNIQLVDFFEFYNV